MRVTSWLAVVGVVALLAMGVRGATRPTWTADTHPIAKAHGSAGTSSATPECVLKANDGYHLVLGTTNSGRRPSVRPGSIDSGNFAVKIPPVVFIVAYDGTLVVTTNTGHPPQRWDTYFYIAGGKATVANASTRNYVIAKCTKARWRPSA